MDSNQVNKEIRQRIRPLLKGRGFSQFTARNSWRFHDDRIDVINFRSFNQYMATALGCTTFSFAINLGCFLTCIPQDVPEKSKDGLRLPEEYQCHFRCGLRRSIWQCIRQWRLRRPDIWFIDRRGKNLSAVVEAAKTRLEQDGLTWFERFSTREEVLRILLEEPEDMRRLWGFGANPSPMRSYLVGHLASAMGKTELAEEHLAAARQSGCFNPLLSKEQAG